jgi:hypothetical protein
VSIPALSVFVGHLGTSHAISAEFGVRFRFVEFCSKEEIYQIEAQGFFCSVPVYFEEGF